MRVAAIVGYVVSAAFGYCGIVNLVVYVLDGASSDLLHFTAHFPLVAWPLAVALFLYLLIQMARTQERRTFAPAAVPRKSEYVSPSPYLDGMDSCPQKEQPRREVYFRMQPPPSFSEEDARVPKTVESSPLFTAEEETADSAADNLFPPGEEIPEGRIICTGEGDDDAPPETLKENAFEGGKTENLSFFRVE